MRPLSIVVLLCGCLGSSRTVADGHQWLDSAVINQIVDRGKQLSSLKPELGFVNGQKVNTCEQYFLQDGPLLESSVNFLARSHYLVCDALKLSERWAVKHQESAQQPNIELCSTLSLSSFRHSLRARIDTNNITPKELLGDAAICTANSCEFQDVDRYFAVTGVLAVNEKNEPAKLWVWVTDEVLSASYRSYTAVWFTWDHDSQRWLARQVE